MPTALTRALGIRLPVFQAPMGGANATPAALVATVSEHGGLGFIGAAYMSPAEISAICDDVRARTVRPWGINLFTPTPLPPVPQAGSVAEAMVAAYHGELGLAPPAAPAAPTLAFDEQLDAAIDGGARVFSFTFGLLDSELVERIKSRGMYVIGTATTVREATELEASGVDAIVAQGSEAGAHRGTFAAPVEESLIGTMALVPQVVDAVRVPVIASGGIMDGRGIVAAMALGAGAVQMGTAFLTCDECGVAPAYKDAILSAHAGQTRVTRAFSGRAARGIVNRFMREVESSPMPGAILPFPYQNGLTRTIRAAAAKSGRIEFLSLWAGQGSPMARREPAAVLMRRLESEMESVRLTVLGVPE